MYTINPSIIIIPKFPPMIIAIAAPDSAPPNDLYDKYGLSSGEIARQVLDALVVR